MAQGLYNVIDRVFIGRAIPVYGIEGITVAFPFMLITLAFSMLVGFGGTALISIRLGEQKKAEAEHILGNVTTLSIIAAIVVTAVGLALIDPILWLSGATDVVMPYARAYLRIIVMGSIFQMLGFGLNAIIRGEGNPRIAMLSMLISVVLNVILAPIFIFWFHWGMEGAALATVVSQAVMLIWVVAYFLGRSSVLKLTRRNLRLNFGICLAVWALGLPACLLQLAASVFQSLLFHQLAKYGSDVAVSAMGIVFAVVTMIIMPVFGINQGAQPIIGYNFGAERFDRVKKTLETAILAASSVTVLGFAISFLFPYQIVHLFVHDKKSSQELIPVAVHAVRICTIMFPIVGFQVVSAGYFQAVGKPLQAMTLMLSRQLILLIPAVLILPRFFGLDGVWASLPTADFVASAWTGVCLLFELRHLHARHLTTMEEAACVEPFPPV